MDSETCNKYQKYFVTRNIRLRACSFEERLLQKIEQWAVLGGAICSPRKLEAQPRHKTGIVSEIVVFKQYVAMLFLKCC